MSVINNLKRGLSKTRDILFTDIDDLFSRGKSVDDDFLEELEEKLVMTDLGVDIAMDIIEKVTKKARGVTQPEEFKEILKTELHSLFQNESAKPKTNFTTKPHVIMVVGVNGTGKTTTLGKLAMKFKNQDKKVLIAAADTFRAAAIEQVEIWANRAGVGLVRHKEGADPAAVAFDGVDAALARKMDVLLIDTAGRLHTQKNLMEELKKIKRTVEKRLPGAPHQVLMVLDAGTGQNALSQAKLFNEAVGLTDLALTKLDGTAKGGIVASVGKTMDLPIRYIGVGEGIDDLQDFDAKLFVNALFD